MDKGPLFRDPADWARDWGWVSRRRALNLAVRIEAVAEAIEEEDLAAGDDDDLATVAVFELRAIAKALAPKTVPAQRERARREREEQARA